MHDCGFDPGRRGRSGEAKRVRPHPNPTRLLIFFLSTKRKHFHAIGCVAASGSDFSWTSLFIPCSRELASLLSRINSLFCLLGNLFVTNWGPSRFRDGFSQKTPESAKFAVFFPVNIAGNSETWTSD